jgi:hypothetical protein
MTVKLLGDMAALVVLPIIIVHVTEDGDSGLMIFKQPKHASEAIVKEGLTKKQADDIHNELLLESASAILEALATHFKISDDEILARIKPRMSQGNVCTIKDCKCPACEARKQGLFVNAVYGKPS